MKSFIDIRPALSWDYKYLHSRKCTVCGYVLHPGKYGMDSDGMIAQINEDPTNPKNFYHIKSVLVCDKDCADKIKLI